MLTQNSSGDKWDLQTATIHPPWTDSLPIFLVPTAREKMSITRKRVGVSQLSKAHRPIVEDLTFKANFENTSTEKQKKLNKSYSTPSSCSRVILTALTLIKTTSSISRQTSLRAMMIWKNSFILCLTGWVRVNVFETGTNIKKKKISLYVST